MDQAQVLTIIHITSRSEEGNSNNLITKVHIAIAPGDITRVLGIKCAYPFFSHVSLCVYDCRAVFTFDYRRGDRSKSDRGQLCDNNTQNRVCIYH